jgi:hypothetical protein
MSWISGCYIDQCVVFTLLGQVEFMIIPIHHIKDGEDATLDQQGRRYIMKHSCWEPGASRHQHTPHNAGQSSSQT